MVNEARVVGVKVGGECADTLQRPEEEGKKKRCQGAASTGPQVSTDGGKMLLKKVNNTNNDRSDSHGSTLAAERETLWISLSHKAG